MKAPKEILNIFEKYTPIVDEEIENLISCQDKLLMYDMMKYFFGYLDENLKETSAYGGKHFRSGICLLLADFYGEQEKALKPATSIEIFHNFSLIHDDVEDCDPIRRGRQTVWKKWGINHGINTGDAQLILANIELAGCEKQNEITEFLNKVYLGVAEGQFLDFTLAEKSITDPFVSEERYLEMITRKSGILVAAAAKTAGIIAGKSNEECKNLWNYGLNLGRAYQLNDDLISIWGSSDETGKEEGKDLEERKKTLPVINLYNCLSDTDKKGFISLYNSKNSLSKEEVNQIKKMLSDNKTYDYVWEKIREFLAESKRAINNLSISDAKKKKLILINNALIPNMKWWDV